MNARYTTTGFSTIELLIAFSVALILLPPLVLLALRGEQSALDVTLLHEGVALAAQHTHDILATVSPSTWYTRTNQEAHALFTHHSDVTWITPCAKTIDSRTEWTVHGTHAQYARSSTIVTSPIEAHRRGGCDPLPLTHRWVSPQVRWRVHIPHNSQLNASDIVILRDKGRIIAAVSTIDAPNATNTSDLYAFDVTERDSEPTLLAHIDTGPGISALASDGEVIFAASRSTTRQLLTLQLFDDSKDIDDPAYYAFSTTSATSLPGVGGAFPEARAIMYYNHVVHIGTWNNNIPARSHEYHAFDVSTPHAPRFIGSLDIRHSVNAIDVQNGLIVLATTDDRGELTIVDASHTPHIHSRFDVPGSSRDAEVVHVVGTTAYLGLERGSGPYDVVAVDMSNSRAPLFLGAAHLAQPDTVRAFLAVGDRGFSGSDASGFVAYDLPHTGAFVTVGCSPSIPGAKISALAYTDQRIFAATQGEHMLIVVSDDSSQSCS